MKQAILRFLYSILAFFSRIYLKRTKPEIIGVTGSVGKTSCRLLISQVLRDALSDKKVYSSPKNYNSEIGIICSIFKIENYNPSILYVFLLFFKILFLSIFGVRKYDILVLEYGVDSPNDMDFLISVVRPDISIMTKLDYIHSENFPSKEDLWLEKSKLIFAAKKLVFLNKDDSFQTSIFSEVETEKYFYNEKVPSYEYTFENGNMYSFIKVGNKKIKTNLLGEENIVYLELAFKIAEKLGASFDKEDICLNFDVQLGRFSILEGIFDSVIVDSSYNAGPESMKSMIKNTVSLRNKFFPDYEILFVLGDMREIGKDSSERHKELYNFALKYGQIISVGKETLENFGPHIGNFKYANQAGKILKIFLSENPEKKYLILFKGSQNTIFLEEAIKEVLKNKDDKKKLVRQEKYWDKNNF